MKNIDRFYPGRSEKANLFISKKLSIGKDEGKEYSKYKINEKKPQEALASLESLRRSDLSRKLVIGKDSQRSIRIANSNEGSTTNSISNRSLIPRTSRLSRKILLDKRR